MNIKNITTNIAGASIMVSLIIAFPSCRKLVEAPSPKSSVNGENVFKQDNTAAAVVNGIYARMTIDDVTGSGELTAFSSVYPALLADELTLMPTSQNVNYNFFYQNAISALNQTSFQLPWERIYTQLILKTNDAIERLTGATGLTPSVRNQLLGQTYFLRALGYFYLANYYGDLPLVLSTDYQETRLLSRTPQLLVFRKVVEDLKTARTMVSEKYISVDGKSASNDRITPNRSAVDALLARTYLYLGEYALAEQSANAVIEQEDLYELRPLKDVFLINSKEAIWQLQSTTPSWNTKDGQILVIPETGPDDFHPFVVSDRLWKSFELGDSRKTEWVGIRKIGANEYRYPNKYKAGTENAQITEYKMVLRLGELYLIRAEARAELDNFTGAKEDLDMIRERADLDGIQAKNKEALLDAIAQERRVELFTEWGDRWFNLRRTQKLDGVMSVVSPEKGGIWQPFKKFFPLPLADLERNRNLVQNPGY